MEKFLREESRAFPAGEKLPRAFYQKGALDLAPLLLGKILCRRGPEGLTAGRIVETEAYVGPLDDGAHSCGGRRTERTSIQYGPGGFAYVFGIYGMHWCFNVVCGGEEQPEVVLVRALEPVAGRALMAARRGTGEELALCSGPGKLCRALGITKADYGLDLCGDTLWLEEGPEVPGSRIALSPRVNIDYAVEYRDRLWRFFIQDSPYVSRVPKRFSAQGTMK